MTMANDACRTGVIILGPPLPSACKHRAQLPANKRLDEHANPIAYTDLDWIKPVVEKVGGGVRCRLEGIRLHGNVGSCPVAWCSRGRSPRFTGVGRIGQLAIAGRLTAGSSLSGAMVSSVM